MSAYTALSEECTATEDAEIIRQILTSGCSRGSAFYTDGIHVNTLGVQALAPSLDRLAQHFNADAVISDSCLCAHDENSVDRHGALLQNIVGVPVFPVRGARFLGYGFKDGMVKAWRQVQPLRVVVIVTAGNDLKRGADGEKIRTAVRRMRDYWAADGTRLVFVDVVPPRWQAF